MGARRWLDSSDFIEALTILPALWAGAPGVRSVSGERDVVCRFRLGGRAGARLICLSANGRPATAASNIDAASC
ncbi:hypothetical protein SB778_44290, partial [Paraburkholderia sp. SIMBA_050]